MENTILNCSLENNATLNCLQRKVSNLLETEKITVFVLKNKETGKITVFQTEEECQPHAREDLVLGALIF